MPLVYALILLSLLFTGLSVFLRCCVLLSLGTEMDKQEQGEWGKVQGLFFTIKSICWITSLYFTLLYKGQGEAAHFT